MQLQGQNNGLDNLITKIVKQETELAASRKQCFDPSKKLNDVKINMANLEWYKKHSKEKGIGYYDSFKSGSSQADIKVVGFKKALTQYWKDMVDEAEKKPQKEGASFRTRWLGAGTNYRRMIEPLDIAEYYKEGGQDYIKSGRPEHYKKLEQWLKEKPLSVPNKLKKENVASNLTEDSCFWAHVEEARISCQLLSRGKSSDTEKELENLRKFENYVYGLMKYYAVSPEIFLPQSSFMQWWKEIMGTSYGSNLSNLVKDQDKYATGSLEIP